MHGTALLDNFIFSPFFSLIVHLPSSFFFTFAVLLHPPIQPCVSPSRATLSPSLFTFLSHSNHARTNLYPARGKWRFYNSWNGMFCFLFLFSSNPSSTKWPISRGLDARLLQRGLVCVTDQTSTRPFPPVHSVFNCRFSKHFTPRRDADVLRITY